MAEQVKKVLTTKDGPAQDERITSPTKSPPKGEQPAKPKSVAEYVDMIGWKDTLDVENKDPRFRYFWMNFKEPGRMDQLRPFGYVKVLKGEGPLCRYADEDENEFITTGKELMLVKTPVEEYEKQEKAKHIIAKSKLGAAPKPQQVGDSRPEGVSDIETFEDEVDIKGFKLKSERKTNG